MSSPIRPKPPIRSRAAFVAAGTAALLALGTPAFASAAEPVIPPAAAATTQPTPAPAPTAPATSAAPAPATPAPATPTPAAPAPATPTPAAPTPVAPTPTFTAQAEVVGNSLPIAYDDAYSVAANHTLTFTWASVLKNDVDPDGGAVRPASAKEPLHGSVDYAGLLPGASITYTPTANFTGSETLSYTISDEEGGKSIYAGNITITVVADHAPVAVADTYSATSGVARTVAKPGLLKNDSDADGDLSGATVSVTALPSHGTVALTGNGGFTYTSTAGYVGQDAFYYRMFDGHGRLSAVTPVTVNVSKTAFTTTAKPTITGTAQVGQPLTAHTGTWAPTPTAFSYQWMRSGVAIAGATASTFTPTAAELGKPISVKISASKPGYITAFATSTATGAVKAGELISSVPFLHGGAAIVGETITTNVNWGPKPVTIVYQWTRNGVAIAGATGPTYKLVLADAGTHVGVTVVGTKAGYATMMRSSTPTAAVQKAFVMVKPTIAGTLKVGKTVSAVTGTWSPTPSSFTYQWRRDNVPIAGATKSTYKIVAADAGHALSVFVTGHKPGYYSGSIDNDWIYFPTK